jgi:CRP-like cAMP-binding protein
MESDPFLRALASGFAETKTENAREKSENARRLVKFRAAALLTGKLEVNRCSEEGGRADAQDAASRAIEPDPTSPPPPDRPKVSRKVGRMASMTRMLSTVGEKSKMNRMMSTAGTKKKTGLFRKSMFLGKGFQTHPGPSQQSGSQIESDGDGLVLDEDDAFLQDIKATMNDEHQSLLGIQVGRKKQALVVMLSEDRKHKIQVNQYTSHAQEEVADDSADQWSYCSLPLIHPFSARLLVWQAVLVVMICYNMLFVPYELAYGECGTSETTDTLDAISDAFFILDVVVQLHVMLVIHENHTDRTLIVDDRSVIAKEYLRFQFWVDVISIGPPFGSEKKAEAELSEAKYFRVGSLKILKLFRIAKAFKILANMVTVSASVVQRFNVAKLILLIIYCSHLLGCAFSGVARWSETSNNWVEGRGVYADTSAVFGSCGSDSHTTPTEEYVSALYWAAMTLTTVGYGDVTAQNKWEMLFSTAVMIGGAIFYALVLGSVTSAIQELSSGDQAMLLKLKLVDKFIGRYHLKPEMASRLKQSTSLQGEWSNEIFQDLFRSCHPEFKAELLMAIHRPILMKTSFFRGVDDAFLKLIVGHLRMHVCLADDCIYKVGNVGEAMFLLNQGFVGIYHQEVATRITLLEPGDAFGLGAVLSHKLSTRIETAVAEVRSVIHSLSREALRDAAVSFPAVNKLMASRVLALMKKRGERRDKEVASGKTASANQMDTITIDVFQGMSLPSTADIMNTGFYCRAAVLVSCKKCVLYNSTSNLSESSEATDSSEATRQFEYNTSYCASCKIERKSTEVKAHTFDPEWNETLELKVPSGKDVEVLVGVYQRALVPICVGFVKVGMGSMAKPQVEWWQICKQNKRGAGQSNYRRASNFATACAPKLASIKRFKDYDEESHNHKSSEAKLSLSPQLSQSPSVGKKGGLLQPIDKDAPTVVKNAKLQMSVEYKTQPIASKTMSSRVEVNTKKERTSGRKVQIAPEMPVR